MRVVMQKQSPLWPRKRAREREREREYPGADGLDDARAVAPGREGQRREQVLRVGPLLRV